MARAMVFSDSEYCVKGLTIWRSGWKKRNWMKEGQPMPNRDLWLQLEVQLQRVRALFQWVHGHNGNGATRGPMHW